MADKVIESFVTQLGFDFDDKELTSFEKGLSTVIKGLAGIVTAAGAAGAAIFAFTKNIAESNDALGKFALTTGLDVKALQELGFVAELNGSSLDTMNSSLANLSRIASEAARGMGPGVEAFGMLGLSVTDASGRVKDADQLFFELSDTISQLGTQAEKLEFAQKLGIDQSLVLAIDQGSEALKRQQQEARDLGFAFGKDAAQAAADFNDEMLRVNKIIGGVASTVGTELMKVITPMIKLFTNWFKANRKIIQQNLTKFLLTLVDVIRGVFSIGIRVLSFVNNIVQAFGGWQNAIMLVVGALAVMNASLLLVPLLVAGAATLIFLLLEDLMKFAQGGESAIGALIEKFPFLETPVRGLISLLEMIAEGWKLIFTQGDEAIEGMIMALSDLWNWFKALGTQATEFGKDILNSVIRPLNHAVDLINKIPGIDVGQIGPIGGVSPVPGAGVGGGTSIANNTTTTNNTAAPNIKIEVNGGNTEEVRRTLEDVLNNQYNGAVANFSTTEG